jgi:hypothetical protein
MRLPFTTANAALKQRMAQPWQVQPEEAEAEMPPYMESFLAHLRLVVGVPFEYLIADPRLLPDESIRFFYLDRSWTDRLVDGAVAVGKIGSREQAHHQAHAAPVSRQLDLTERGVRELQRGVKPFVVGVPASGIGRFAEIKLQLPQAPAGTVTGFLLRSAAVAGWPHMDVRAYRESVPIGINASDPQATSVQLRLLRLERLAPAVLLALFEGVPKLVHIEEPHHGVQFGVQEIFNGPQIPLRNDVGQQLLNNADEALMVKAPVRVGNHRVLHIAGLVKNLRGQQGVVAAKPAGNPHPVVQTGSASLAIAVLNPPWRQRFEGTVDHAEQPEHRGGSGLFVGATLVAAKATQKPLVQEVQKLFTV